METKQKIIKKIFSAPTKKADSTVSQKSQEKEKTKVDGTKCTSFKTVAPTKKSNDTSTSKNKSNKKGDEKLKTAPKSLTDEEYAEIFKSVLAKPLTEGNEEEINTKEMKYSSKSKDLCKIVNCNDADDFEEMECDLSIDQWNEEDKENKSMCDKTYKQNKSKGMVLDLASNVEHDNESSSQIDNEVIDQSVNNEETKCLDFSSNLKNLAKKSKENSSSVKVYDSATKMRKKTSLPDFCNNAKQKHESKVKERKVVKENSKKNPKMKTSEKKISYKKSEMQAATRNDKTVSDNKNDENYDGDSSEDETGTWIQCSVHHCGKWRYVASIGDPIQVPDYWDCTMNPDKLHNSCDAAEVEYDESDHILTTFTLGSIVWAKMDGFPWWPAMVDTDPDYDTYFELPTATSMLPNMYHVTFFDDRVSRAWIRCNCITPYDYNSAPKNTMPVKSSSKKEVNAAMRNADIALKLDLQDRLKEYSFENRYKKKVTGLCDLKSKKAKDNKSSSSKMLQQMKMDSDECNLSSDEDIEYLPTSKRGRMKSKAMNISPATRCGVMCKSSDSQESMDSVHSSQRSTDKPALQGKELDPTIFTMELDTQIHSQTDEIDNDCGNPRESKECELVNKKNKDDNKEKQSKVDGNKYEQDDASKQNQTVKGELKTAKKRKSNDPRAKTSNKKVMVDKDQSIESVDDFDSQKENQDPNAVKIPVVTKQFEVEKSQFEEENVDQQKKMSLPAKQNKKRKTNSNDIRHLSKKKSSANVSKDIDCGLTKVGKKDINKPELNSGLKRTDKKDNYHLIKTKDQEKDVPIETDNSCRDSNDLLKLSDSQMDNQQEPNENDKDDNDLFNTNACIEKNQTNIDGNNKPKTKPISIKKKVVKDCKGDNTSLDTKACIGKKQKTIDNNDKPKTKSISHKKKVAKGFVIPVKHKNINNVCEDWNVPDANTTSCTEDVSVTNKKKLFSNQHDQSVPDIANNVSEEEVDLTCSDLDVKKLSYDRKIDNTKDVMIKEKEDSDDEDELNLSMDSLDDNTIGVKNEKVFGKMGSSCVDIGSDSDPFELIEE